LNKCFKRKGKQKLCFAIVHVQMNQNFPSTEAVAASISFLAISWELLKHQSLPYLG
jgi:hypothetical protein